MVELADIQDALLEQLHAGEEIDREEVLGENPEHADDLKAFFALLDVIEAGPAEGAPSLTRLGEFRIVREIGRGGMGIVYEAEQSSLKRKVALKVLPPTLRMEPRLVSRFRREAEAAGRLRHPGIVPVYSVGEAAGAPFFAMELVEGETLEQRIEARREEGAGTADAWRRWAVETVARVADALAYAHEQGILHRDVKPGNIIVDTDGTPRLTDFGLALDVNAPGLTLAGEVFGSPQYMSPEQAVRQEAPIDARTDVYSLAVTLYELLTLRLPYDAQTSAELLTALATGTIVPPRKADPGLPRALELVLLRALRKNPRERYAGAAEFAADLRAALEGKRPVPAGPTFSLPLSWFLVVGVLLVAFVGYRAFRSEDAPPVAKPRSELARWLEITDRMRLKKQVPRKDFQRWLAARETAERFCQEWNEFQKPEETQKYKRLEQELKKAGAPAATYLLEVLGTNQYDAFGRTRPEHGVTARMQVRALNGIYFLDVKEAVPHVLLHCRGPSLTCTSTAATVLQKLTGENFDAGFLKDVDVSKIDWWAKNQAGDSPAFRALVEQILRELRANVKGKVETRRSFARDWWSETGALVVRDLATLLNTNLPYEKTTDKAAKLKQVERIEAWWRANGGS